MLNFAKKLSIHNNPGKNIVVHPYSKKETNLLYKYEYRVMQKAKGRSDSVNSMASQGPLDDQSCQNSNLNKNIKEEYLNLLQLTSKKGKYTDSFFPPVISSLFSYSARKKNKYPNIKWMRLSEVYEGQKVILINTQQSLVNARPSTNLCAQYFSLGLNVIRNNRALLKKMFQDQAYNEKGIYYVKIFQAKVWKYIIVDDHIPIIENNNQKSKPQPVFIKCEQYSPQAPIQIWPYILEKALAKYYSSYEALQSGNIFDFLQQLTNRICQQCQLDSNVDSLKQIVDQPDTILFGQTKQSTKTWIKVNSRESPPTLAYQLNCKPQTCSLQALPQKMSKLYKMGGNANYSYIGQCPIRQSKQSISVRQFKVQKKSCLSLSLIQKDKRFFQQSLKYQYSWVRMILMQKEYQGYRWIDGRYDNQKGMHIQGDYQPGEYFVVVITEWRDRSYQMNLFVRAKFPIRMDRKVYEEGMIEQACADLAQRYGRLNQLNTYICSYNCIHQDMGLIIQNINNQRMKGQIKIVRSIDGLKSKVEIQAINKQFQNKKSIQVIIKHNSHFTVVLKMKGGLDREFFQNFDFGGR